MKGYMLNECSLQEYSYSSMQSLSTCLHSKIGSSCKNVPSGFVLQIIYGQDIISPKCLTYAD